MKQRFGFLDHCLFDHLRYFLFAAGSPFFILFFPTHGTVIFIALGVYLLGLFLSFVELCDEKKYDFWD